MTRYPLETMAAMMLVRGLWDCRVRCDGRFPCRICADIIANRAQWAWGALNG